MDRPEPFSEGGTTQHNTTQHDSQEGHCSVELVGVSSIKARFHCSSNSRLDRKQKNDTQSHLIKALLFLQSGIPWPADQF